MSFCEFPLKVAGSIAGFAVKMTKRYIEVGLGIIVSIPDSSWKVAHRAHYSQGTKPCAVMGIVLFIPTLKRFVRVFLTPLSLERYCAVESEALWCCSASVIHGNELLQGLVMCLCCVV